MTTRKHTKKRSAGRATVSLVLPLVLSFALLAWSEGAAVRAAIGQESSTERQQSSSRRWLVTVDGQRIATRGAWQVEGR